MTDSKIEVGTTGDYLNTNLVNTDAGSVHNEVIDQGNIISPGNSRAAATLAAGATFQGVGEEVRRYGRVGVAVVSDNATDGTLTMETSLDNITWGGAIRTWSNTNAASTHMWNISQQYFRIKYVNGTTEATNLAIQVQYSNNANILLSHQLDEPILDETECIITRNATDLLDISKGLISGTANESKFGYNPSVGTSEEDIWEEGGLITWLTVADEFRIKSGGDAADTAAGAGARSVFVVFLDENFVEVTEELATAGASASAPTSVSGIRFLRAYAGDCGSYATPVNTGAIVIETEGGVVMGGIAAEKGQSEHAAYTVPLGKTAYVYRVGMDVDGNKNADISLWQRRDANDITVPFTAKRLVREFKQVKGDIERPLPYLEVPQMTDLWASAVGASGGVAVSIEFDFILKDN